MLSGGLNKLDGWKETTKVDGAEKQHRGNEEARARDHSLEGRLQWAFENYRTGQTPKIKEPIAPDKKEDVVVKELPKTSATPDKPVVKQTAADAAKVSSTQTKIADAASKPIDSSTPTHRFNSPQARAASHFVVAPKQPQSELADLLLKKPNTPPTPPKSDDGDKKTVVAEQGEIHPQNFETAAAKVPAALASGGGAKLADATTKRDKPEIDKKEGKRAESKEGAKGKSAAHAARADGSEADEKLEASVSSGSGGPIFFNADTKPEGDLSVVLSKQTLLRKYVYKNINDPATALQAEAVLTKALSLNEDPELNRILQLGLAGRSNVYGVRGA